MTNKESFENVKKKWIPEISKFTKKEFVKLLIGNKIDLKNEKIVSEKDARKFADEEKILHCFETSAANSTNVQKAFIALSRQLIFGE